MFKKSTTQQIKVGNLYKTAIMKQNKSNSDI